MLGQKIGSQSARSHSTSNARRRINRINANSTSVSLGEAAGHVKRDHLTFYRGGPTVGGSPSLCHNMRERNILGRLIWMDPVVAEDGRPTAGCLVVGVRCASRDMPTQANERQLLVLQRLLK